MYVYYRAFLVQKILIIIHITININYSTNKVSLIIDEYNITINNSKQNDSLILNEQLDTVYNKYPILFDNNKSLIADADF